MQIFVNPLSINQCFRGRRYKTKAYKQYEHDVFFMIAGWNPSLYEKMELDIKVGFRSKLADIDNIAKPFIDILQKKYCFNDRQIFKLVLEKEIVEKNKQPYLDVIIKKYEGSI